MGGWGVAVPIASRVSVGACLGETAQVEHRRPESLRVDRCFPDLRVSYVNINAKCLPSRSTCSSGRKCRV